MRAITFLASVVALAAVAGCGQYRPIDPYTGVDLGRSPGVADVQAAYKAAQEMMTVSKGNYAEPYFRAFERLKTEQERWLTKPRAGGPLGARLARWRVKYKVLARKIYGATSSRRPDRKKIAQLDYEKALRDVEPFLMETELLLAKERPGKD